MVERTVGKQRLCTSGQKADREGREHQHGWRPAHPGNCDLCEGVQHLKEDTASKECRLVRVEQRDDYRVDAVREQAYAKVLHCMVYNLLHGFTSLDAFAGEGDPADAVEQPPLCHDRPSNLAIVELVCDVCHPMDAPRCGVAVRKELPRPRFASRPGRFYVALDIFEP